MSCRLPTTRSGIAAIGLDHGTGGDVYSAKTRRKKTNSMNRALLDKLIIPQVVKKKEEKSLPLMERKVHYRVLMSDILLRFLLCMMGVNEGQTVKK